MSECTCDKFVVVDDMPIFVMADGYMVDNALSTTSTNPVQNAVITTALNSATGDISDLQEDITNIQNEIDGIDNTPITYAQIEALFT